MNPEVEIVNTDVLVVGGGMAGCGAAYEAKFWAKNLRVVLVEKAAVERSGAVAQGLSAINTYLGQRWGQKTPEDFVKYVRTDLMGIVREDLVYDMARHVDSSVHLFEEWGLPIWKTEDGKYLREGPWQIMINGESFKPIVSEAAKTAIGAENLYEKVVVTHLLNDPSDPNRISGAVGFGVRDNKLYVFKAKAVIVTAGGATLLFRPKSPGEGLGRTWYTVFDTGSTFAMQAQAGATMTQMENRFIPSRFKDGYGPVGAWFLLMKSMATNGYGENYLQTRAGELAQYEPYGSTKPLPTPLRNHQMLMDIMEGNGPIYMRTEEALAKLSGGDKKRLKELEGEAWEDFLDMTVSQALLWAAQNVDPAEVPSEITMAEPYIMGSHSGCSGMWVSGPEDLAPAEFFWGYNRMTTVKGLFTAGDGVGAAPHKFSSGSFTEGRLAAKAAVAYCTDNPSQVMLDEDRISALKAELFKPLETFEKNKGASTVEEVNPRYILPRAGLVRLQKIMGDYAAGPDTWYRTSEPMLTRGLELLLMLKEDLTNSMAARDLHELLRGWELNHRVWTAEAHIRHMLYRKETRWPGYYYRTDYPHVDDENWRVFVNSRYDAATNKWELSTVPYVQLVQ